MEMIGEDVVPHKVRVFAWRAYKNGLLTKYNLKRRQVLMEDKCIFCDEDAEDVLHALYECPSLRQCWESYGFDQLSETRRVDFAERSNEDPEKFCL